MPGVRLLYLFKKGANNLYLKEAHSVDSEERVLLQAEIDERKALYEKGAGKWTFYNQLFLYASVVSADWLY